MSFISTPFNSKVPLGLRVAYPWMTNQAFVDFWSNKFVPASDTTKNYVAARIVAGHTPAIDRVAALEEFNRANILAGDHLIVQRFFLFGDTLAASALDVGTASAKLTWFGVPTVTPSHVVGDGTTQYGLLNDVAATVFATNSASMGFFSLDNIAANKYVAGYYNASGAVTLGTLGGVDQMASLNTAPSGFPAAYAVGGSKCGVVSTNSLNGEDSISFVVDDTIQTATATVSTGFVQQNLAPAIMAFNSSGTISSHITARLRAWYLGHAFPTQARHEAFMFRLQKLLTLWYPFPS